MLTIEGNFFQGDGFHRIKVEDTWLLAGQTRRHRTTDKVNNFLIQKRKVLNGCQKNKGETVLTNMVIHRDGAGWIGDTGSIVITNFLLILFTIKSRENFTPARREKHFAKVISRPYTPLTFIEVIRSETVRQNKVTKPRRGYAENLFLPVRSSRHRYGEGRTRPTRVTSVPRGSRGVTPPVISALTISAILVSVIFAGLAPSIAARGYAQSRKANFHVSADSFAPAI